MPTASLATVLAGLDVNADRGDALRADLYRKTRRVLDHLDTLGVQTPNTSGFPLIEIPLQDGDDLSAVARRCWTAASTSRSRRTRACRGTRWASASR